SAELVWFTRDNGFHKCKTFVQEADPWQWLATLEQIGQLEADVIVPGHGEPCSRPYLAEQARVIENWIAALDEVVSRGLSLDEALAHPFDFTAIDPYAPAQRLLPRVDWINQNNITNLHKRVSARQATAVG